MTSTRATTPPSRQLSTMTFTAGLVALALLGFAPAGCGGSGGATPHDGAAGTGGGGSGGATPDGGTTPDGGGDTNVACPAGGPGQQGQLVLAVTGLPAGTTPMVRVNGAGLAAPMVLTIGTPVTLAAQGGYEIDYRRVKVAPAGGAIVGKAYYLSASSFDGCIRTGATATATLTYTQEPGSEHMWIGVSNAPTLGNEIGGFVNTDLAATNDPATTPRNPAVWKTKNFVGRPGAGAFDSSGNFWVPGDSFVNMYAMETLATPGDAAPDVVLMQPDAAHANFAAFDSSGNLWVTRGAPTNQVVRYTLADQAASGAPVPAVIISSPDLANPGGLAFDKDGFLWVACEGNDEVVAFTPAHLGASYAGAADVVLTAKTAATAPVQATYTAPVGLAFDQAGNLWVGYVSNLVGFTPSQQAATALVAGPIALNVSTGTGGFAFDESGGVWVSGGNPSVFRRFPKTALGTTGDATPDILITSSDLGYAESIVLDPAPTWSPLQDQL